ncbi:hypothetical protein [Thiolapillus sp.]
MIDFGTSQSPKSTRPLTTYLSPAVLVTKHYATTSQACCCSALGSQ